LINVGNISTIDVNNKNKTVVVIITLCKETEYSILLKYGYNVKDIEAKNINHKK
jgi:hypothetical protein